MFDMISNKPLHIYLLVLVIRGFYMLCQQTRTKWEFLFVPYFSIFELIFVFTSSASKPMRCVEICNRNKSFNMYMIYTVNKVGKKKKACIHNQNMVSVLYAWLPVCLSVCQSVSSSVLSVHSITSVCGMGFPFQHFFQL